ncbi:MAG: helix-turn-helix transcriptional regulator [Neisseriaceae bacterium]|nr:helix-turn-helix transcriptional regulator [Neisseriaceae bacterium]
MDLQMMRAAAGQASAILKSLGNEDRLILLCHLSQAELSVGELSALTGIVQPTLSQQLGVLRTEQLVATRRDGKHIYYRIADDKVKALLQCLYDLYCPDAGQSTKE